LGVRGVRRRAAAGRCACGVGAELRAAQAVGGGWAQEVI
jgi:hypothetical protein